MIICTEHELKVGDIKHGNVTDANLNWCRVAFRVIRETTEAEYRERAAELSTIDNPPFDGPMRFYEVAMD